MTQSPQQWLEQADYDLATAEVLLREERYFYAVFMCHLALEKALKGLYRARAASPPPRTHNLVFLLNGAGVQADGVTAKFLVLQSEAQIAARYPEDLDTLRERFPRHVVEDIVAKTTEALRWIRRQF